jgi:hypothetical protein
MKTKEEILEFIKDNISKLPYVQIELLLDIRELLEKLLDKKPK